FPKAAPRMIPMAMSITFPRMANSLNSFSMFLSSFSFQRTTDYGQRTFYSKPLAFDTTPEYACRRTNSTQPGVHMATTLPDYVRASVPNPPANRGPWYKNTAPSYAGIFLWVAFYLGLAGPTISQASLGVALLGLVVMGLLQLGWFAVATYFATDYIMQGLHKQSKTLFVIIALLWAYILAWIAIKGIAYVARVAQVLNWVPLIMILIVFWANKDGISNYQPPKDDPLNGFLAMLGIVIGFFATAGAAGADFGMNNRNRKDIVWGGLVGIALALVVAGGLPLLSVAGFIGKTGTPNFDYAAAIASVGALAPIIFFLFAAASLAPTC